MIDVTQYYNAKVPQIHKVKLILCIRDGPIREMTAFGVIPDT